MVLAAVKIINFDYTLSTCPIFALVFFCILLHIYPPITRKRAMRHTSSLWSYQPSVYHTKVRKSRQVPFLTTQQVNLPACSSHCPFTKYKTQYTDPLMLSIKQGNCEYTPMLQSLVWPNLQSNPSLQLSRQMLLQLGNLSCYNHFF